MCRVCLPASSAVKVKGPLFFRPVFPKRRKQQSKGHCQLCLCFPMICSRKLKIKLAFSPFPRPAFTLKSAIGIATNHVTRFLHNEKAAGGQNRPVHPSCHIPGPQPGVLDSAVFVLHRNRQVYSRPSRLCFGRTLCAVRGQICGHADASKVTRITDVSAMLIVAKTSSK